MWRVYHRVQLFYVHRMHNVLRYLWKYVINNIFSLPRHIGFMSASVHPILLFIEYCACELPYGVSHIPLRHCQRGRKIIGMSLLLPESFHEIFGP